MSDRFFPNQMPDFVEEKEEEDVEIVGPDGSLLKLLSMPYSALAERFIRAGLDLKETVVVETWGVAGQRVRDFSVYCGTLGTALLLFKAYQVTNNREDLVLCSEIVKACDSASASVGDATFLCGRPGVCALGAVAAKHLGDEQLLNYYLHEFKEFKLPNDIPDELLYGRAGFLWTCVFLNRHLGEGSVPSNSIDAVIKEIFKSGKRLGVRSRCPLMFEFYGEKYWGAAHGLAGIMHVLMHVKLSSDEAEEVKRTLRNMIKYRFPSGNYPATEQDVDWKRDHLVHWCHGAPGVAITLVKAAEVFGDEDFLEAAANAAEVVWNRGLLKRVGLCHGISGNTYVFLSLYRLTGNIVFLYRAKAFACFLLDRAHKLISEGKMHGGEHHYSLFEGLAGMAHLFLDMPMPSNARFPAYEI